MGGEAVWFYIEGADLDAAFRAAAEQDRHEHGLDSIFVDKTSYFVIDADPLPLCEAEDKARRLIDADNDPRIADRWGPLGAIAVRGEPRTLSGLPVPDAPAGYDDTANAVHAAVRDHLFDGETVTTSRLSRVTYIGPRVYPTKEATTTVTVSGATTVTGWLLVGWCDT